MRAEHAGVGVLAARHLGRDRGRRDGEDDQAFVLPRPGGERDRESGLAARRQAEAAERAADQARNKAERAAERLARAEEGLRLARERAAQAPLKDLPGSNV